MKTNYILGLLLLISVSMQSQELKDLIFDLELNKKISERKDKEFKVYEVKSETYKEITQTYLKKISKEYKDALEAVEKAEMDSILNFESNNLKLLSAREKLNKTEKYIIVKGTAKSKSYDVYSLGKEVIHPEEKISGNYKALGEYSVLEKEQLSPIKASKTNKKGNESKNLAVLIQHPVTKSVFLVEPDFINQFASHHGMATAGMQED